jgi:hypothetical protein
MDVGDGDTDLYTSVFEDAEHELAEKMPAVVPRRRRAVEPA